MIEEPPLIRVAGQASRRRPSAGQIAAFQGVATGFVADAMDGTGALDFRIKPLPGLPEAVAGPALTCWCGPADILGLLAAFSEVQAGDVIVNATEAWTGCAALGDQATGMARNAGAAGIVTDGLARDIAGLRQVGLPVYAMGLSPNSPHCKGPGTVGLPVEIGGRRVESGDMIVADADGVVVIPFAQIDTVAARLDAVAKAEAELEAQVAGGLILPPGIPELLDSDQVRRD